MFHILDAPPPKKVVYQHHHDYPPTSKLPSHMTLGCFMLDKYPITPSEHLSRLQNATKFTLADLMGDEVFQGVKKQIEADKIKEEEAKQRNHLPTNRWGSQWSGASPCSTPGPQMKDEQKKQEKEKKLYEEKAGGLWIKELLARKRPGWEVHWNSEIPKEARGNLEPFFTSPKYRPDIWLSLTLNGNLYQLLMMEVLSNEDIDLTVSECDRSLLNQIRVFRNRDISISELSGFVLPTSKVSCELLQVTVK